VAVSGKKLADREVIHLLNFSDANSMEWRDTNGTQTEPTEIADLGITITVSNPVQNAWFASPDIDGGVSRTVEFSQSGNELTLTLPSLKYWDMLVLEY
jgi:dextranase